jgi:hypothetical protein
MKKSFVLLALALLSSGCVGARGYFTDRWRDAKDVFTVSVGTGIGAKARVGPVNAGLFLNSDAAGLRGGEFFYFPYATPFESFDCVVLFLCSADSFDLRHQARSMSIDIPLYDETTGKALATRAKCYSSCFVPPDIELPRTPYYYTQLEVAAGVGGTLRLGFNIGELLDFLLGWTTLDIFSDDLEARREREAAEKKTTEPPTPPVPKEPGATP